MSKNLFCIFIILFAIFFTQPTFLFAADKWNTYNLSLFGGIDPNGVGKNGIIGIGLNTMTAQDYAQIQKIAITIEPYTYDNQAQSYIQIADATQLSRIYVSFYHPGLFRGDPLIEGEDYSIIKSKDCVMGNVSCVNYLFTLLDRSKLTDDGYFSFYFESFKLLKTGSIKVRAYVYDQPEGVEFTKQGFIDLPVYEVGPITTTTLTPTLTTTTMPSPTALPTNTVPSPTLVPQSTQAPIITPKEDVTPSPIEDRRIVELEQRLAKLSEQQKETENELNRQKTLIGSIIEFLKNIFSKIPLLN